MKSYTLRPDTFTLNFHYSFRYHTFFGICGLCLLGCGTGEDGEGAVLTSAGEKLVLKAVDPAFAMPVDVVKRLGLSSQRL